MLFVAEDGEGNEKQGAERARNAPHRRLVRLIVRVLHRRFAVIYGEIVPATSDDLLSAGSGTGVRRERGRKRERKRENESAKRSASKKKKKKKRNAKGFGHLSPALLALGASQE